MVQYILVVVYEKYLAQFRQHDSAYPTAWLSACGAV